MNRHDGREAFASLPVLYEDNHLLVLNKPADWIVQGANQTQNSLLDWATFYVRDKYNKPGNIYLGIVSRLDAPVTGVLPLARTSKCASRLSEQFRNQLPTKIYWAIVEGLPAQSEGRLEQQLVRDDGAAKTRVIKKANRESQLGILEYRVINECKFGKVLEIKLITGRKHQIRAQLESISIPIVGDKKYSSRHAFPKGIALHCHTLQLEHPTTKSPMHWTALPPSYWRLA